MNSNRIKVGFTKRNLKSPISFCNNHECAVVEEKIPVYFDGNSHMITIAPTGSGKSVSSIIPNLLNYHGPVIAIDPKGELLYVTKRAREAMGHKVIVLDPFKITKFKSGTINPLDISKLDNFMADTDSLTIAENFAAVSSNAHDPFWDRSAKSVLGGIIHHAMIDPLFPNRSMAGIRDMVCGDLSLKLCLALDTRKNLPNSIKTAFTNFLNAPENTTKPSIQVTASSYFENFHSETLDKFLSSTSFKLKDIVDGNHIDIYIVFPPDKLQSHSQLLRLILVTLFKAILSRNHKVEIKTLFILDECATLGYFPLLETMLSLGRGYGIILHTIWQDLGQIKRHYGHMSDSFLSNSGLWQLFGNYKYHTAQEVNKLIGVPSREIMNLKENEQILYVETNLYSKASKMNYLIDKEFEGSYDPNPYHIIKINPARKPK